MPEIDILPIEKAIARLETQGFRQYFSETHEIYACWSHPYDGKILHIDIVINPQEKTMTLHGVLSMDFDIEKDEIRNVRYTDWKDWW